MGREGDALVCIQMINLVNMCWPAQLGLYQRFVVSQDLHGVPELRLALERLPTLYRQCNGFKNRNQSKKGFNLCAVD